MKAAAKTSIALAALATAGLVAGTLSGCGSSSTHTVSAAAATHVSVIQYTDNETIQCTVLTFPVTATGTSATPSSTLTLPAGFDGYSLAYGPTGKLYVGGNFNEDPSEILVYAPGASGNAQPIAAYTGNTPGTFEYPNFMTVNSQGKLFVFSDYEYIDVFDTDAQTGDLPLQHITTYYTADYYSEGIGADSEGNIYVSNDELGEVDVFAAGATGAATPVRSITSTATNSFVDFKAITAAPDGTVIVANYNDANDPFADVAGARDRELLRHKYLPPNMRKHLEARLAKRNNAAPRTLPAASTGLYVFAPNASGAAAPTTVIQGSATNVIEPGQLATDAVGNIYYTDCNGGYFSNAVVPKVMVFSATATGNAAPTAAFSDPAYIGNYDDQLATY